MSQEEWRDVVGFEGLYQVSNWGRCRRTSAASGTTIGRIIKPKRAGWKGSYLAFSLWVGNKGTQVYVHRAVIMAFVGAPPHSDFQVNHKDGNKHNNRLENLEWSTPFDNQHHRYDVLGKGQEGERNGSNKYSEAQIRRIFELFDSGQYTQRQIAEMVGIDYRYVNRIVKGAAWKHLR